MSKFNLLWITDANNPTFQILFKAYFNEMNIKLKEDTKMWDEMNKDIQLFDIKTVVLLENDDAIGFTMFQVDQKENPWCMVEGAGDIREFYVQSEFRKQGYGSSMFNLVKNYFNELNIKEIYLTTSEDDGEPFWFKQGFKDTGKINPKNKLKEFVYNLS